MWIKIKIKREWHLTMPERTYNTRYFLPSLFERSLQLAALRDHTSLAFGAALFYFLI
jgi:hypothetical protein